MRSPSRAGETWTHSFLFVLVASVATALILIGSLEEAIAYDLVEVYVPAAERLLDGDSPFPALDDPAIEAGAAYVYPPLTALLAIPLTPLSGMGLALVGVVLALALLLLSLWVAGVRDPRCYAVFALWPPTLGTWENANVTALVLLTVALTWRFRDSWPKVAAALGFGIALKLLLWPLSLWLLMTGRIRAAVGSVLAGAALVAGSWAVIGFEDLRSYPDLLSRLTDAEGDNSHGLSIYQGMLALGLPSGLGHAVSAVAAAAMLAGALALARRGDDRGSFTLALVAALAVTPLVWLHYLTFLAIPLAIYRPRLSWAWAVPWLLWVVALPGWPFEPRPLVALVVVVAVVGRLLTSPAGARLPGLGSRRRVDSAVEASR